MTFVANELAEANRLKKIELKLRIAALRSQYKDNPIVESILADMVGEIEPKL